MMPPCPNLWCPQVTGAAGVLLLVAWLAWAPYILRRRPVPLVVRLAALVLLAAFLVMVAVVMPLVCGPCEGA
jgi:hypothetical protein